MRAIHAVAIVGLTLLLLSGCSGMDGSAPPNTRDQGLAQDRLARSSGYAESVYDDYQSASDGRIAFQLRSDDEGALSKIAELPLGELLSVPNYWMAMDQLGTEITNVRIEDRNPADDEWSKPIFLSRFETLGRPTEQGRYRMLWIEAALNSKTISYRAVEVCWESSKECIVIDPVVLQLDAFSNSRRELMAQGWSIENALISPSEGIDRVCSLNSHPTWGGEYISYPAFGWDLKDIFRITLVHKDMAAQRVAIDCYVSGPRCLASPSGFSNRSSCWSTLGWNCSCGTSGSQSGVTRNAAKADSETRCTHAFVGSASASWSRRGSGANFSIQWSTNGGVTANGGDIYDACSWH